MKIKKIIPAACVFLVIAVLFSSCGYRLRLEKKEDDTTSATQFTTANTGGETAFQPEDTTEETTAFVYDGSYYDTALSADRVLALYSSAMNDVKNCCPGFHVEQSQQTGNVSAGSGRTQLANSILALVGQKVLDGSDISGSSDVKKGSADAVKNSFPLFGRNTGCALTSDNIISSAVCETDGKEYKITICLNDTLNPSEDGDFAKIMPRVDVDEIKNGISEYLVVLDYSQFRFDMNYTNCKIVCTLDKATSRMTSLTVSRDIEVEININLDLIVFKTQAVKCSGTIYDKLEYNSFVW